MGSTNIGNQILTYDFRQDVIAVGFNRLNYKLHPKGIYEGGNLVRISDTQVSVLPMVCLYNEQTGTQGLTTRIETLDSASVLGVSPSSPYIVGSFTWIDIEDNYMDFLAVSEAQLTDDVIIFGRATFNGSVMTPIFDYSQATYSMPKRLGFFDKLPFYVEPNVTTGGYSSQIKVLPGGPFYFNGKVITVSAQQILNITSAASTGRSDIIYINSVDNSVNIAQGAQSSGAPLPTIETTWLPIAIISMPPNAVNVRGDYISYINPTYNYLSNEIVGYGKLGSANTWTGVNAFSSRVTLNAIPQTTVRSIWIT